MGNGLLVKALKPALGTQHAWAALCNTSALMQAGEQTGGARSPCSYMTAVLQGMDTGSSGSTGRPGQGLVPCERAAGAHEAVPGDGCSCYRPPDHTAALGQCSIGVHQWQLPNMGNQQGKMLCWTSYLQTPKNWSEMGKSEAAWAAGAMWWWSSGSWGGTKAVSRTTTLDFRRAHTILFRDLFIRTSWDIAHGEKRGPGKLVDIQGSPPPSSGKVHPDK